MQIGTQEVVGGGYDQTTLCACISVHRLNNSLFN